jgi:hypothetical protein
LERPDKEITAALVHPITLLEVVVVAQALSVEEVLLMLMALVVRLTIVVEAGQGCVLPLQDKECFMLAVAEVVLLQTWLSHLVLTAALAVGEKETLKVLVAQEQQTLVAVAEQVMRLVALVALVLS